MTNPINVKLNIRSPKHLHVICVITSFTKYSSLFCYKDYEAHNDQPDWLINEWSLKKKENKKEKRLWKKQIIGYLSTFEGIEYENIIYSSETNVLRKSTYGTKIHCNSYSQFIKN